MAEVKKAPDVSTEKLTPPKEGRKHKATYATDKKKGGYLVRVAGPQASGFTNREVPVETKAGLEHLEKLTRLIWSGNDTETGTPCALYAFEAKPRDAAEQIAF